MMQQDLLAAVKQHFGEFAQCDMGLDMVTVELPRNHLVDVCHALCDNPVFKFDTLIDICGVDYLHYGCSEWRTDSATATGFSRGVADTQLHRVHAWGKPRFGVIYHLLSVELNQRIRLKVYLDEDDLVIPSVMPIWDAANWFEREAYDLFGIQFHGHPDLRRLLTDYGFKGHPFRKDFPLVGEVEMRYDAATERCVYEPVSVRPRVLVPKVIRQDNRYRCDKEESNDA
jgi:NADH-quinone oxidoreductase subunit C